MGRERPIPRLTIRGLMGLVGFLVILNALLVALVPAMRHRAALLPEEVTSWATYLFLSVNGLVLAWYSVMLLIGLLSDVRRRSRGEPPAPSWSVAEWLGNSAFGPILLAYMMVDQAISHSGWDPGAKTIGKEVLLTGLVLGMGGLGMFGIILFAVMATRGRVNVGTPPLARDTQAWPDKHPESPATEA